MKKWLVVIAILVLLVAHQDYWQWDRRELVYGFLPYNMVWHIGLSIVTAITWVLVCTFCWPRNLPQDKTPPAKPTGGDRS